MSMHEEEGHEPRSKQEEREREAWGGSTHTHRHTKTHIRHAHIFFVRQARDTDTDTHTHIRSHIGIKMKKIINAMLMGGGSHTLRRKRGLYISQRCDPKKTKLAPHQQQQQGESLEALSPWCYFFIIHPSFVF